MVIVGQVATCRGNVAESAEDNTINTLDSLNTFISDKPAAIQANIINQYNQYIGPNEPEGFSTEDAAIVANEIGVDEENLVFVVRNASNLSGGLQNGYETLCKRITGDDNLIVQVTDNNYTVCAKP